MENVPVNTTNGASRRGNVSKPKSNRSNMMKKLRAKTVAMIVGSIIVIAAAVFGVVTFYNSTMGASIDNSKNQAVFFTNGQVYFGKLNMLNGGYMKLTDIYYLQAKDSSDKSKLQDASGKSTAPGVELIKLGSEVHGPEDAMIISKDQILFFENLKADGKVSEAITQYNKSNG